MDSWQSKSFLEGNGTRVQLRMLKGNFSEVRITLHSFIEDVYWVHYPLRHCDLSSSQDLRRRKWSIGEGLGKRRVSGRF
jgi:hypothetical protein